MVMIKTVTDNFRVGLLGSTPVPGLDCVSHIEALAPELDAVVLEHNVTNVHLDDVRASFPKADVVAWYPEGVPKDLQGALGENYDGIALSQEHLLFVLNAIKKRYFQYQRFREQQRLTQGVLTLVNELAEATDLQGVLRKVILRLSEIFSIERVSVVMLKPESDIAFVVMEHEAALLDTVMIRLEDYPEIQEIMRTGEPLLISDVLANDLLHGVRTKIKKAAVKHRSAMLFPLHRGQEVIGVLFLRSPEPLKDVDNRLMDLGRAIALVTSVSIGHVLDLDKLLVERRAMAKAQAKADEELADLKQFYDLLEREHDGVLLISLEGVIAYANQSAGLLLNSDAEYLKGKIFSDFLDEASKVLLAKAMQGEDVTSDRGYVDLEMSVDEQVYTFSSSIQYIEEHQGILLTLRDVTELREIEDELRQTKDFLENLIQSSVDAIVAADMKGRILLFNRAAEQILGYSAMEAVGHLNVTSIYDKEEAYQIMRIMRSEGQGGPGRLEQIRRELIAKNGEKVPVSFSGAIIYEQGQETASVGIFTDLRERLRMEEKLSEAQRRVQMSERQVVAMELAGVAAHELNQPLTSILGYAEMLDKRLTGDDVKIRKSVDVILRETERMAQIVRRIGQITKYETKSYVGKAQILALGDESQEE